MSLFSRSRNNVPSVVDLLHTRNNALNVSQDVGGQPVQSSDDSWAYYPTITTTTGTSITSTNTTNFTYPYTITLSSGSYSVGPNISKWGGQVFFEPSAKLRTLMTALQLL